MLVICSNFLTDTRLGDVDLSKTSRASTLSIWTEEIQAKTEE